MNGRSLILTTVVAALCATSGCGDNGSDDEGRAEVPAVGQGSLVARCKHAALGNGDPNWRDRSIVAGRLGFINGGDFRSAQKVPRNSVQASHPLPGSGPILGTKVPVVVEGSKPIEVSIAPEDRSRAGLTLRAPGGPYAEVRFVPCRDQARTGWPAAWVLRDREPVQVTVEEQGRAPAGVVVGSGGGSG